MGILMTMAIVMTKKKIVFCNFVLKSKELLL